jgi:hypothetical protein
MTGNLQASGSSGLSVASSAQKVDKATTAETMIPNMKMPILFIRFAAQEQPSETENGWHPDTHEDAFVSTARKPKVDREGE